MSVTAKNLIASKYAANSSTNEYTAPSGTRTIIDKFTVTNIDASSRTISIYLVPSGSIAGNSNLIVKDLAVAAGATDDVDEMKNQILNAGDFIEVVASSATTCVIRASGRECT